MYIILAVTGWAWCLLVVVYLAVRLKRGGRAADESAAAENDDQQP